MSGDASSQEHPATHDASATATDTSLNLGADPGGDEETPELPPRLDSRAEASVAPSTEHGPEAPAPTENEHPQVALLRGMFPDFDTLILQSVLESVNYDQDSAIDVLLGMSDPDYVSSATHEQPQHHDLALDEQLARQLALEDQQQQHASGQSWPRRNDVPYQPRQQGPQGPQQQQQQYVTGNERGDLQEFQETLGKMAESGKRTFSSIVTKAKAKITELNEQYNQRSGQPPVNQTSQRGPASSSQVDRHTASQAVAQQYYGSNNPNAPYDVQTPPAALYNQQPQSSTDVRGYDVGSTASLPSTPGARTSSPPATSRISMSSPRPSGEVPQPPRTSTGSPIDAAKLGLLPKRPVSLLIPQSTTGAGAMQRQESEDELEYVENPFEEGEGKR
ncbi:uncharacterized protein B0H18DRAFT_1025091 [Fomitopsis serialis]|uniref:uncharacterized protein n=1 Tax=Fomitopsis serialis TaxID=139415 RepID=UPI002007F579|nr:uncharacterized protein B0H18DRAFT_1049429 [Neoantrodia serialis]XP_047889982.1 uncharacterized protein B0H18DRAFT_1025091 [Neoantrodia serialis]KAH9913303.1 hypothetical protein B0H18DRAFT_1049429 [Neoantrodia serialis]KAH9920110.1 hypothetical protein B0H18DRAFT_1025091 [Neoantrodia serialis]